jgi:hypothetical protein
MRARGIFLLGVVAYGVFLAATMPARWALAHLALPPQIAISNVRGTVWNGTASVAAAYAPSAEVRWHFLPARLASARLAFAIDLAGTGLQGHGEVSRGVGGIEARAVTVRADAAALCALAPLAAAWRPRGTVTLDAPALAWDGRNARGNAHAVWREAALAVSDVRPLGTYRLDLTADGGPARLQVTTVEGALRIAGHGTFTPPGALAFSGEARAEANSASALAPLLDLLGPPRADGARALDWRSVPPRS